MASTYSDRIKIEKIATGEKSGEWGTITNNNFDRIDIAVNGIASIAMTSAEQSSGAAKSIALGTSTVDEAGRHQFIEFTAGSPTPTGTLYAQLQLNTAEKVCFIRNSTAQTLIVFQGTYSASNDLEIAAGKDAVVKFDGGGSGAVVELALKDPEFSTVKATTFTGNLTGDVTGNADTATTATTATKATQIQVSPSSSSSTHYVLFSSSSSSSSAAVNSDPSGIEYVPSTNTLKTLTIDTTGAITSDNAFNAYNSLVMTGSSSGSGTSEIKGVTTSSTLEVEFDTIILKNYAGDTCIRTTDESAAGKVELYYDNNVVLATADSGDMHGSSDGVKITGDLNLEGRSTGTTDPIIYIEETSTNVGSGSTANTIMELNFDATTASTPSGGGDGAFFIRFTEGTGTQQGVISGSLDNSVSYATSSDERLKEDIQHTASQWELIRSLNVRDYSWKKTGNRETGFIAQELYEAVPKAVSVGGEDANKNPWSVDYGRITPFLVKALQEAMDRIEELEDRLNQVS